MTSTSDEVGHTATPWTCKRAHRPVDGEYDYAIIAEFDGKPLCIAEVFGRVSEDIRPNAEATAALIVNAVNSHDSLAKALGELLEVIESDPNDYGWNGEYDSVLGEAQDNARAALSQAKGGK